MTKRKNITLWIFQILLALTLLSGAVMKFMPIEKLITIFHWTGQVPLWFVRFTGLLDLLASMGLVLPMWLGIKPRLTIWAAFGTILLMISAIVFHISRNEISSIGFNIFVLTMAGFVVWGRKK